MPLALIDRPPIPQEMEKLRLVLSTFQDGTGQHVQKDGSTVPGWRDFERAVALTFGGIAQENKAIFDVLIPDVDHSTTFYGISCKMRRALNDVARTSRVTIELSNSAGKFWQALERVSIRHDNYKHEAEQVGKTLITLIESWHHAVSESFAGNVDLTRSCYLVLSWNLRGEYQLHQFRLSLRLSGIEWLFPAGGTRLLGNDAAGKLYEWYGESGGQLKYYPLVSDTIWTSERFRLEPLPSSETPYGLLAKAAAYFPRQWLEVNPTNDNRQTGT